MDIADSSCIRCTFERHGVTSLCEHFNAAGFANLAGIIANRVAAIFVTLKAHPTVKHLTASTAICCTSLLFVQKRVNEQVDGTFMLTFDGRIHGFVEKRARFD